MGLMDMLNQVLGSGGGNVSGQQFDQVAQAASPDVLSAALSHAFRSEQTPSIGAMVAQLFGNSSPQQQAGMLNQILASLGPGAAATLGSALGGVPGPGGTEVTPAQASQLTPQQVEDVVHQAHQNDPGIADQLAAFYAQHSGLIKTLGGAALAIAMAKMKEHVDRA